MQKTAVLSFAAALLLVAGCQVDPTKFSCSSSAECPTGYHCDLGTTGSAATFKCSNGAAPQKTLTADASKFLLVRAPSPDGTVRTTITAAAGAVTSTPDFVGVRLIASQGGADLADSQVATNGSVLAFQLPQATAQVSLRVQDDSGHFIPVTGYSEEVELSFVGREVAGTSNQSAAYDVTTQNDSLFPPAAWIASGPGPGGRAKEFTATNTVSGGTVQSSASYASIAYPDYSTASTTSPPLPTFGSFSPASAGSPMAWQPFRPVATLNVPAGGPAARIGAAVAATGSGFFMFGGLDGSGAPVDPQGSFQEFDISAGWTVTPAPTSGPLPSARGAAALGARGSGGTCYANSFNPPCDFDDLQIVAAGGQGASGAMTNEIQLFNRKSSYTSFNLLPSVTTSWRVVSLLPFANAGMQSAPGYVPFNAVVSGSNTSQSFAGGMMIYGRAVTAANSATQGCVLFGAAPQSQPFGSPAIAANTTTASCVGSPSVFDQTSAIGFRTGATLVSDTASPSSYYLFGGKKTTGATTFALQNDIWKATIACTAIAPAACTTTTTWTQISGGGVGTGFPTPRAGAGGGFWSQNRLVIYGGTDANGALSDLWEYDFTANTWRQPAMDQTAGVLTPPTRSGFAMTADQGQQRIYAFGGLAGATVTDQMWLTGHESAAKLLVKVPFSVPNIDQAQNVRLSIDAMGTSGEQAFIWDGATWRYVASTNFNGVAHIVGSPTVSATSFLQPDGNFYLLFMHSERNQFTYTTFTLEAPVTMDRLKITVDFQ